MVGVCLIGVAIYASMNMSDGSGMVSSIKRASLAALQPMRGARSPNDAQSATGQKEDRIQMTAAGFATRQVIHDTVVEHQGSREFITIKPYLRIIAGLATDQPENADPPSLQSLQALFRLHAHRRRRPMPSTRPVVEVNMVDVPGRSPAGDRRHRAEPEQVDRLVGRAAENFAYAELPLAARRGGDGEAKLQLASYRPDEVERPRAPAQHHRDRRRSADEDEDDPARAEVAGAETKIVTVGKRRHAAGPACQSRHRAKSSPASIIDSLDAVFGPEDLKPKQKIDFWLVRRRPTPDAEGAGHASAIFDTDGEPHRHHGPQPRGRLSRLHRRAGRRGRPRPPPTAPRSTELLTRRPRPEAPADTILKLLRVHSYDVDFKQKVRSGDTFEMFFDGEGTSDDKVGELLYTSMTVDAARPANSIASAPRTTRSTIYDDTATAPRSS